MPIIGRGQSPYLDIPFNSTLALQTQQIQQQKHITKQYPYFQYIQYDPMKSQQILHIPCNGHKLVQAEHSHQQSEQFYHMYICHRKYHHSSYSDAVRSTEDHDISNKEHKTENIS